MGYRVFGRSGRKGAQPLLKTWEAAGMPGSRWKRDETLTCHPCPSILPRLSPAILASCSTVLDQSLSHVRFFSIPWDAAHQASLSFTISWSLLKLKSTESVMSSNHLILRCPLLLLPSIFPSIKVFSSEKAHCIRWLQSTGASASVSVLPMNIQV